MKFVYYREVENKYREDEEEAGDKTLKTSSFNCFIVSGSKKNPFNFQR